MLSHQASNRGPQPFPNLPAEGTTVDLKACVEPGTAFAVTMATVVGAISMFFLVLATYGVLLVAGVVALLFGWYFDRRSMALIRGSGVHIGPKQLPEIHRATAAIANRLGLKQAPEVFLVEDSVINAAAVKLGKKQVVLLTDDLIEACLRTNNPDALVFVLGHELGHMALGHNGRWRAYIGRIFKKLSRLDEYSADRVGTAVAGNRSVAAQGLLIMTAGPHMLPFINVPELAQQAREVKADSYSVKAEKTLTHPLLLHRLQRVLSDAV